MQRTPYPALSIPRLVWTSAAVAVALTAGNLAIAGLWLRARRRLVSAPPLGIRDIGNLHAVDDTVWRGGAPSPEGYRSLAAAGVTTIVDLRAEGGTGPDPDLGMDVLKFPIRDGQLPSAAQIDSILEVLRSSSSPVFVHCAAGVGRTGAVITAYLADQGASTDDAIRWLLGVGPPSLEQLAFACRRGRPPGPLVTAVSRILDAPRRTWSRLRGLLGAHVGEEDHLAD